MRPEALESEECLTGFVAARALQRQMVAGPRNQVSKAEIVKVSAFFFSMRSLNNPPFSDTKRQPTTGKAGSQAGTNWQRGGVELSQDGASDSAACLLAWQPRRGEGTTAAVHRRVSGGGESRTAVADGWRRGVGRHRASVARSATVRPTLGVSTYWLATLVLFRLHQHPFERALRRLPLTPLLRLRQLDARKVGGARKINRLDCRRAEERRRQTKSREQNEGTIARARG